MLFLIYLFIFIFGIVIGSFLNVLILRIPKKEDFIKTRSHCMECGYQLKWYELIPIFSYLFLKGRCHNCKAHISVQYPLIEGLNGVLWVITFIINGLSIDSLLYCLLISALIVLSVIDERTQEIPLGINVFIFCLGVIMTVLHFDDWLNHVIGFFAVSVFIWIIIIVTRGRGMGGGDLKLMAAAGLLLGWKEIILAFALGCILGAIIHVLRMKIKDAQRVLAFGPYLALGILITVWFGEKMITWYLGILGI